MPQIGEITPGVWLLGGFGGHGLNTTAMGGEMLAHAIVEGDTAWKMFSPFALVWAGGALGRTAQRVSGWSHGAREMVDGALARTRHTDGDAAAPMRPRLSGRPLLKLRPRLQRLQRAAAAGLPPVAPEAPSRHRLSLCLRLSRPSAQ